jgi:hypothetical protein
VGLPLASYKLRFHEQHVRALPARDEAGRPFTGPGVDLRGAEARPILEAAGLIRAWLVAREPGIVLRALSVDIARPRVLVSLEGNAGERPRVLRLDAPQAIELVEAGREIERLIGDACAAKVRAR